MLNKYKTPLNLFIVFEKMNPVLFTSKNSYKNHFTIFIDSNWYFGINVFFKNELFFSQSMLSEMTFIDTLKYNNFEKINFFKNNRLILMNIYTILSKKTRINLMVSTNKLVSIETIFKNANWLEREASEMFGGFFIQKKDTRPLLLDYSRNEFPMLKDFPCEGYQDLFYDFFENELYYIEHEFIEL